VSKKILAYFVSIIALIVSIGFGVTIGTVAIPISTLWNGSADAGAANILWNIRMPRVVLAGMVGASLAIAGAAFQGLLKNPLADPYTLGISSGASVGAVITLFFGISIPVLGIFTTYLQHDRCVCTMLGVMIRKTADRSMK
jgi:iron complex transport system permease protein